MPTQNDDSPLVALPVAYLDGLIRRVEAVERRAESAEAASLRVESKLDVHTLEEKPIRDAFAAYLATLAAADNEAAAEAAAERRAALARLGTAKTDEEANLVKRKAEQQALLATILKWVGGLITAAALGAGGMHAWTAPATPAPTAQDAPGATP